MVTATGASTVRNSFPAISPVALAGDNGMGWYGEHTDKVVTFFGLGIIILFPVIAGIGSFIQGGQSEGMQGMDATLAKLVAAGEVTALDALDKAVDKDAFAKLPFVTGSIDGTTALA